ncbi:hypothetical protein BC941DRAFT_429470 [Chlamydoabsidia padenii]|nr:hypothetical protein BC941DRAFT_429470 [Chlamydoabsidia padenii]
MMYSLKTHLADTLGMELNKMNTISRPDISTVLDAKLEAKNVEDWDAVDRSSQILELVISIWHKNRGQPSLYKVYFLPATLNRPDDVVDAKDYPLLLVKINQKKVAQTVKRWIQKEFGCHITNFHVSGSILTALVNWWSGILFKNGIGTDNKNKTYSLELSYHISFSTDLTSITFNITLDQLQKMQKLIQDTDLTMMDLIKEHVYKTLRIKMDHCILTRVGTPIAYISNTSQMKLLTNGPRSQYLEFLSELCDLAGTTL